MCDSRLTKRFLNM